MRVTRGSTIPVGDARLQSARSRMHAASLETAVGNSRAAEYDRTSAIGRHRMIFVLDNYDSFTYNLVQRLGEIDRSLAIEVARNDGVTIADIAKLDPERI